MPDSIFYERNALQAPHKEAMEAHRKSDVELLLRADDEDFVLASRGEISHPTVAQRHEFFGSYLRRVRFAEYVDTSAPVIYVLPDGSTGWLIAPIRARGSEVANPERSILFESAWIELYAKRGGRWRRVGNVSNFK